MRTTNREAKKVLAPFPISEDKSDINIIVTILYISYDLLTKDSLFRFLSKNDIAEIEQEAFKGLRRLQILLVTYCFLF